LSRCGTVLLLILIRLKVGLTIIIYTISAIANWAGFSGRRNVNHFLI
jgi:hypothetical protein